MVLHPPFHLLCLCPRAAAGMRTSPSRERCTPRCYLPLPPPPAFLLVCFLSGWILAPATTPPRHGLTFLPQHNFHTKKTAPASCDHFATTYIIPLYRISSSYATRTFNLVLLLVYIYRGYAFTRTTPRGWKEGGGGRRRTLPTALPACLIAFIQHAHLLSPEGDSAAILHAHATARRAPAT